MSATRKHAPSEVGRCRYCGKPEHSSGTMCAQHPDLLSKPLSEGELRQRISGAPRQPVASRELCNQEIIPGLKCDKPIGHTGLHVGHVTATTGAPAMASGMSGAQGWQELPKSNPDGVAHAPEKLFTHSELTTLLERMARLVVQEVAKKHVPAHRKGDGLPILGRMICMCGRLQADGVTQWHTLWDAHLRDEIITESKLQQLREAVERG